MKIRLPLHGEPDYNAAMSMLEPRTEERLRWLKTDPYNVPALCAEHDGPRPRPPRWHGCPACNAWDDYLRGKAPALASRNAIAICVAAHLAPHASAFPDSAPGRQTSSVRGHRLATAAEFTVLDGGARSDARAAIAAVAELGDLERG